MTRLQVDLPPAPWVAVPVDGADVDWAREVAVELCEAPSGVDALAAELAVVGRDAQELGAYLCAVVVPEGPLQTVLAVLVVQEVACGDLDAVAEEVSRLPRQHVRAPRLDRVVLPLGAAVRLHSVVAAPGGTVVERVEHFVPLGEGAGIRVDLSWGAVALGDDFVVLADDTARGLRLVDDDADANG